jgi:hypothetical protein
MYAQLSLSQPPPYRPPFYCHFYCAMPHSPECCATVSVQYVLCTTLYGSKEFFFLDLLFHRVLGRVATRHLCENEPLRDFFSFFEIHKAKILRGKSNFFSGVLLNKFSPGIKNKVFKLKKYSIAPIPAFCIIKCAANFFWRDLNSWYYTYSVYVNCLFSTCRRLKLRYCGVKISKSIYDHSANL